MVKIVSLGGSIVAPKEFNFDFLKELKSVVYFYLKNNPDVKLVFVVGGGYNARYYQEAYRNIADSCDSEHQDLIGIRATHLNAELVRCLFYEHCLESLAIDPLTSSFEKGRILVAGGWKPGFSTDYVSVVFAKRFSSKTLINASNIKKIYDKDPSIFSDAIPLDSLSWVDLENIIGDVSWKPGLKIPFDPVAVKIAKEMKLKVYTLDGTNLENFGNLLNGKEFIGTVIE